MDGKDVTPSASPSALLGTWLRAGWAATAKRGSDGRETWGDAYATYRGADKSDRLDELDRPDREVETVGDLITPYHRGRG